MYILNAEIVVNSFIKALWSNKFQKIEELLGLVIYNQEQNKNVDKYKTLKGFELLFQEEF